MRSKNCDEGIFLCIAFTVASYWLLQIDYFKKGNNQFRSIEDYKTILCNSSLHDLLAVIGDFKGGRGHKPLVEKCVKEIFAVAIAI